jgi:hypothetical protein
MESNAADRPWSELSATVLDTPDPRALARFYCALLGYEVGTDEPTWVTIGPPGGGAGARLSFQHEPEYRRPTWPSRADHSR